MRVNFEKVSEDEFVVILGLNLVQKVVEFFAQVNDFVKRRG